MKRDLIIIFFLFIITVVGCEKKPVKWLSQSWKKDKVEYSTDGINFFEDEIDCSYDDIWFFKKNGDLSISQGIELCGNGSPSEGDWALLDDEKTIRLTFDEWLGDDFREIMEISKEKLVLQHEVEFVSGTWIYRLTFKRFN